MVYYRISLAAFISVVIYLLVSGNPLLESETPLVSAIALGNLLVWLALIALNMMVLSLIKKQSKIRYIIYGCLFFAIGWVPISALLTGNLNNNFSSQTVISLETWILLTGLSVLLSVGSLLYYYLVKAIRFWKQKKAT